MRSVRLFDFLQYDGASWQVVAKAGSKPVGPTAGGSDAAGVLETLDPAARRRTEFLHRHVVEVLTGVPPAAGGDEVEPRPEYRTGNLLGHRIDAKLTELRSAGTPVSEPMFRRHLAAYRRDGGRKG